MKMTRHLVAAALAVGLTGSAMGLTKTEGDMGALAGYALATYAFNEGPAFTNDSQTVGTFIGAAIGWQAGRRIGVSVGLRFGATIGSYFGPVGLLVGAGLGAL